jgi:hypothetical protein
MKRSLALYGLFAAMIPMLATAADPLGPPKASLAPGQFSLGLEYSYADLNLERIRADGKRLPINIDDMNTAYLSLSMGAAEWLEFFVRVGAITMDGDRQVEMRNYTKDWSYDYDEGAIYDAGLRLTLGTFRNVTFGAVASYSYADFDGGYRMDFIRNSSGSISYWDWGSLDAELQQVTVALGATWPILENVSLYGGALLHHVRLTQRIQIEGNSDDEWDPMTQTSVYKNDDGGTMLGGYAGLEWQINERLNLAVEGSITENSCGGSAMLGVNF